MRCFTLPTLSHLAVHEYYRDAQDQDFCTSAEV